MFSNLISNKGLLSALEAMALNSPTDVQVEVIPQIIEKSDSHFSVQAFTGSGKSLCFMLPVLQNLLVKSDERKQALVLSPTRELAGQLFALAETLCAKLDVQPILVSSGADFKKQAKQLNLDKRAKLIIATPGRLLEHLENDKTLIENTAQLVVDESDLLLSMGLGNQALEISEFLPEQKRVLFFSATAKRLSQGFIKALLPKEMSNDGEIEARVERIFIAEIRESIEQVRVLADGPKHKQRLLTALFARQPSRTLIFCNTKKETQELAHFLRYQDYVVSYLHGDLDSKQRATALDYFVSGQSDVLVATDLAARGLNFGDIDWVINYDVPFKRDDYVHRVGRTGRGDEKRGTAINFVTSSDWNLLAGFGNSLHVDMPIMRVEGYEGEYKGPKKLKKSGKAASANKRKKSKGTYSKKKK
jgi:ATP-dependent RNA helicase SrmB